MMQIVSGLISMLITLGIPIGIGILIYRSVKGRRVGASTESAGLMVRRIFHYGITFVALILVAIGLSQLVALALPGDVTIAVGTEEVVARSLAFIIVGVPTLVGMGIWAKRRQDDDPTESASLAWAAYLTITTITSLIVASVGALQVLEWALGATSFEPEPLAQLLAWGSVFGAHWWLNTVAVPTERMRFHRTVGSAIGLGGFAVGVWALLAVVLRELYAQLFTVTLGTQFSFTWREALAGALVGGSVWAWYWLRHTAPDRQAGVLRHTYLLLGGVLSGLIILISSGARALFDVAIWFLGDVTETAARHFDGVPGTVAAALIGAWLWWYHRAVLAPSRRQGRTEIDRVYDYVVSAAGLGSAATGLAVLLTALFQSMAPQGIAESGAGDTLVFAVVLLIVGTPLWWAFWRRIELLAGSQLEETSSTSRRLYLFLLFGLGGVIALVSLLVMLGVVIQEILEGTAGTGLLYDIRIPLALVFTVGAVAGYHWTVYRADRARLPVEVKSNIRDLILVGGTRDEAKALADATGARVQVWERLDNGRPPLMLEEIQQALIGHDEEHLLVVAGAGGVEVVPFRETR